MRRGPEDGYDFPLKRDYRRAVWATHRNRLKHNKMSVADAHVVLMPSTEGDEIEAALNAGFREYNLHVVDENPAIVATLKRRYSRINTYGVSIAKAFERMASEGVRISCANLDFCYKVSVPFAQELGAVMVFGNYKGKINFTTPGQADGLFAFEVSCRTGGVFTDIATVSVSLVRGRETYGSHWRNGCFSQNDNIDNIVSKLELKVSEWSSHDGRSYDAHKAPAIKLLKDLLRWPEMDRYRLVSTLRALMLFNHLPKELEVGIDYIRSDAYMSNNGQSMLWSIWEVTSPHYRLGLSLAADYKRYRMGICPRIGLNSFDILSKDDEISIELKKLAIPMAVGMLRCKHIAPPQEWLRFVQSQNQNLTH